MINIGDCQLPISDLPWMPIGNWQLEIGNALSSFQFTDEPRLCKS
jgi:hypothetical protein